MGLFISSRQPQAENAYATATIRTVRQGKCARPVHLETTIRGEVEGITPRVGYIGLLEFAVVMQKFLRLNERDRECVFCQAYLCSAFRKRWPVMSDLCGSSPTSYETSLLLARRHSGFPDPDNLFVIAAHSGRRLSTPPINRIRCVAAHVLIICRIGLCADPYSSRFLSAMAQIPRAIL